MRHCRFGIWSNGEGARRYGHLPVFQSISQEHEKIHRMAERLVELVAKGQLDEARAGLIELRQVRDTIIHLLQELQGASAKQA